MSVHYLRAFVIDPFGVGCYDLGADLADDLQHFVVAVDGVFMIHRGIIVSILVGESAFFELDHPLHQRVRELEFQFRGIGIKICHFLTSNFVCNT